MVVVSLIATHLRKIYREQQNLEMISPTVSSGKEFEEQIRNQHQSWISGMEMLENEVEFPVSQHVFCSAIPCQSKTLKEMFWRSKKSNQTKNTQPIS